MKLLLFFLGLLSIKVAFVKPEPLLLPTPTPILIPSPAPFVIPHYRTDISVPFVVQAPFNQWKDARYQDACEEATSLMAVSWAQSLPLNKDIANTKIAEISAWETEHYNEYRDSSARDTYNRIILNYFNYQNSTYQENASLTDVIQYLYQGKLVIAPMNGQALHNPYFTQPGPERHMVLIRGYDPKSHLFITNDPGIGLGEKYTYPEDIFYAAIRDYSTGYHIPITQIRKNIIIVSRAND